LARVGPIPRSQGGRHSEGHFWEATRAQTQARKRSSSPMLNRTRRPSRTWTSNISLGTRSGQSIRRRRHARPSHHRNVRGPLLNKVSSRIRFSLSSGTDVVRPPRGAPATPYFGRLSEHVWRAGLLGASLLKPGGRKPQRIPERTKLTERILSSNPGGAGTPRFRGLGNGAQGEEK